MQRTSIPGSPPRLSWLRHGAMLLLPLCLGACGVLDPGFPAAAPGSTSTPTSAPTSTTPDVNAGLLTGATMKTLLVTADDLPKGFSLNKAGTRNSGGSFAPPSTGPLHPAKACEHLDTTGWSSSLTTHIASASFAQSDYLDSYSDEFAEDIAAYRGKDAHTVMSRLAKILDMCHTFTEKSDEGTATIHLTRSTVHGVGDEAVSAVMTSPAFLGGVTIVAVRSGQHVVSVLYSSSKNDKGSAARRLAARVTKRVAAATA